MDRHREWAIIRARLPLLLAIVIVPVVGALLFSTVQAKVYEARATLIVGQSLTSMSPDYTGLLASQRLSGTYARVAMTRPVLGRVVTKLGLKQSTDDLLKNVSASAPTDSTLLTIIAHDPDPVEAAAIANALAAELIAASPNLNGRAADVQASVDEDLVATQAQITSVQTEEGTLTGLASRTAAQEARLTTLRSQLVSLRSTYAALLAFSSAGAANVLTVIEPAVPPDSSISPRPLLNAILAAAVGLLLAGVVVLVIAYLEDRSRKIADPT